MGQARVKTRRARKRDWGKAGDETNAGELDKQRTQVHRG
jgi:hypothetical protein